MRIPSFFELLVFAGITDVGNPVDFPQMGHDGLCDGEGRDDVVEFFLEILLGILDSDEDFLGIVRAFVKSMGQAFQELAPVKRF